MKYYYDLHIHTCLSPCADVLMTPNNILNMAYLKGLDILAITDHNSTLQLASIMELAKSFQMLVIPGVEVATMEGYHVVCLFRDIEKANTFQMKLETKLKLILYNKETYGYQQVLDINDEIIDEVESYLIQNSSWSVEELKYVVKQLGGVLILAHPYKYPNIKWTKEWASFFDGIERNPEKEKTENQYFNKTFCNSDAHQITDILERTSYIELDELSIDSFFTYMEK